MIYVVTGLQRSGTSMMMGCLKAGGMAIYYNAEKNEALKAAHPSTNQEGFYEPSLEEIARLDFPLAAEGMAVKFHAPWQTLGTIAPAHYKIMIMRRDPREIATSFLKYNNGIATTGDLEIYNQYDAHIAKAFDLARNRRDVEEVRVVEYDDVLSSPLAFFRDLGWPLDAEAAAAVVDTDARSVKRFAGEFSGNIVADLGLPEAMDISEAILAGKLKVPDNMKEAAKKGADFTLVRR